MLQELGNPSNVGRGAITDRSSFDHQRAETHIKSSSYSYLDHL